MTAVALLDSARHKLRLADYHGSALVDVLGLHPTETPDDPRRVEMEAHLEGLAYTGTAAAEKTLRSLDPTALGDQMPIQTMIAAVKDPRRSADVRSFGRSFELWWFGGDRYAPVARDLRNDAAHRVYEKAPDGAMWRMAVRGRTIPLRAFADGYSAHLQLLAALVEDAAQLVGPVDALGR